MCEFCTDREKANTHAENMASRLERLANDYRAMAKGHIKPHTADVKTVSHKAAAIIRDLVAEWV